jgi:hypothetical protein
LLQSVSIKHGVLPECSHETRVNIRTLPYDADNAESQGDVNRQIRATRSGDDVGVSVPLPNGKLVIIDLPFDQVEAVGLALLQVANHYRSSSTGSLFDAEPLATPANPRIELRAQGTGEVRIAIDSSFLGPLVLRLDAESTRELRDALTMLVAAYPKPA